MKKAPLYIMSVFYIAAGINHFWHQEFYLKIMPPWLPWQKELVVVSGICEILFALLLIFPATKRFAAWSIIILLIAIFPANVQMLINYLHHSNPYLWIAIVRLPIQLLLIMWAYVFAKKNYTNTVSDL